MRIGADWWSSMICHLYFGGSSDYLGLEVWLHLIEKPKRPFQMLKEWMNQEGFTEVVQEAWNTRIDGTHCIG